MIIPNDTGGLWRIHKFLEYKHEVPYVDESTLVAYALDNKLDADDAIMLAWYHSMAYNEITAALLLNTLDWRKIRRSDVKSFWADNKPDLLFNSSRAYAKNMDWFVPLMDSFMSNIKREPYKWVQSIAEGKDPHARYKSLYDVVSKWKYMGRFSTELWLEILIAFHKEGILDLDIALKDFDWRDGSNVTSGVYNMLYEDDLADQYDKIKCVSDEEVARLDKALEDVRKECAKLYPDDDNSVAILTPRVCAWRNLFKGNRYAGYHHDRQLGNLEQYKKAFPKHPLWEELFGIRAQLYPHHMLGELYGWSGIRPHRKKLWKEKGLLGFETAACEY